MILNLHERWLLLRMGLSTRRFRKYEDILGKAHGRDDQIDIAAQLGGIKMAKRSVIRDLPDLFDPLNRSTAENVRAVVYGHRTYRRIVLLAAALHQAGLTPRDYEIATTQGNVTLGQIRESVGR